jgi:hypothetical protein
MASFAPPLSVSITEAQLAWLDQRRLPRHTQSLGGVAPGDRRRDRGRDARFGRARACVVGSC